MSCCDTVRVPFLAGGDGLDSPYGQLQQRRISPVISLEEMGCEVTTSRNGER